MSRNRNGEPKAIPGDLPVLPLGWCWTTLGQISEIQGGIQKQPSRAPKANAFPYLRVANVLRGRLDLGEISRMELFDGELEKLRLQTGDLLIVEGNGSRSEIGRSALWHGEIENCVHQNHIIRVRLLGGEPKFIDYFWNSSEGNRRVMEVAASTSGLYTLSIGKVSSLPVPVAPLNEQQRIVAKIEELFSDLDAGVAALKRVRVNLKRYRAAVLQAAVTGKLTEAWRAKHPDVEPAPELLHRILTERRRKWEQEQLAKYVEAKKEPPKGWQSRYVEPAGPDTSGLPELPRGWCWATVEQLGEVQLGRQRSPKNRSRNYPTKYIRAANITENGFDLSDVLDMEFLPKEQETYRLLVGDIVLSEASGSPDQAGKPAVWRGEIENYCFQNTVIRFRPCGLESAFPFTVFRHYYFNKVFAKVAAGVSINHLSAAKFSVLPFPLPPLAEQDQIVAEVERRLSIISAVEKQVELSLQRSARLRQTILKRAFEGRLVPQVATDEPASVLLERIQRQRNQQTAQDQGTRDGAARKPKRKEPKGVFYRRAAVVCYVVKRLSGHGSFGRTQLEKILHLSQSHLGIDLSLEFKRYAAGPFDEVIYKLEGAARKHDWFKTQKRERVGVTYHAASKTDELCSVAVNVLGDKVAAFNQLLDHFGQMDTDQAELLATAYAAWNDLLLDGRDADEEAIVKEIYAWDESKTKFDRPRILACLEWMRKQGYVPTGTGQRTQVLGRETKLPSKRKARRPKDTGG